MGFLIWKNSDVKVFITIVLSLVIAILMLLPPDQWPALTGYFLETPPLLIFGQLGILIICSFVLFVFITIIMRLLK